MTPTIAGIGFLAIFLAAGGDAPPQGGGVGARVESDSYTEPAAISRCIAYNIGRKMPSLQVRSRKGDAPGESGYLILTATEPAPATFGVIRIDPSESGSHLTTWLADSSLSAAPEEIARKLVAGC